MHNITLVVIIVTNIIMITLILYTYIMLNPAVHVHGPFLSDNGREFNNSLDDLLSNLLGIKRRLTTPYHPQVAVNIVCTQIISDCVCFVSLYRQMDWLRDLISHCNECLRSL